MYKSADNRPIQPVCFCIHNNGTMGAPRYIHEEAVIYLLENADLLSELDYDEIGYKVDRLRLVTAGIREFVAQGLDIRSKAVPDVAIQLFSNTVLPPRNSAIQWDNSFPRGFFLPGDPRQIPVLKCVGEDCCLGQALSESLDLIAQQVKTHHEAGRDCLRPILVVVSAGRDNDGLPNVLESASRRCRDLIVQGALTVLMYGTTKNTNMELLSSTAPGAVVKSVDMTQIPWELKNVWQHVTVKSNRDVPVRGDAKEYILGVFSDVE